MYRVVIVLVIFFMPPGMPCIHSQLIPDNPEHTYDSIRALAFDGKLEQAEVMARELVKETPGYGDAAVLLARIVAWQERYDAAIAMLDSLLAEQPEHEDAMIARETIQEWLQSGREEELAQALAPEPGQEVVNDTTARGVDIFLGYSFDTFKKPYSRFWQIFRMGAQYETAVGPVLGTVNFGNLHADAEPAIVETGLQLQAEFWPEISERSYAWFAYAYSPFKYFPGHRAAAEYWYSLDKGWVVSGGASYFYFDRNIFIPTLSLEKYKGNYWFSSRTYIHLKEAGTTASLFFTARRYSNDFDYIQVTAGAGTAPDEPWDLAVDLDRQEAYTLKLAVNRKITDHFSARLSTGASREQYSNDSWRNRFEAFINIIYSPGR